MYFKAESDYYKGKAFFASIIFDWAKTSLFKLGCGFILDYPSAKLSSIVILSFFGSRHFKINSPSISHD